MAVIAAEECIEDAGVDPSDIDLVLLGTFTPDQLLPASACFVQDRLGLSGAGDGPARGVRALPLR